MVQLRQPRYGVFLGVGALDALLALDLMSQKTMVEEPTNTRLVNGKRLERRVRLGDVYYTWLYYSSINYIPYMCKI